LYFFFNYFLAEASIELEEGSYVIIPSTEEPEHEGPFSLNIWLKGEDNKDKMKKFFSVEKLPLSLEQIGRKVTSNGSSATNSNHTTPLSPRFKKQENLAKKVHQKKKQEKEDQESGESSGEEDSDDSDNSDKEFEEKQKARMKKNEKETSKPVQNQDKPNKTTSKDSKQEKSDNEDSEGEKEDQKEKRARASSVATSPALSLSLLPKTTGITFSEMEDDGTKASWGMTVKKKKKNWKFKNFFFLIFFSRLLLEVGPKKAMVEVRSQG
jgi:hypothetical protein